ncbi:hypothetical protein [Pseudomonas protegens]|uniref:hypothetical protein n=1 Tax=Pseudomonas protegens TaxID=380021 RepID=UPI0004423D27|nr:hypothetical protein [Pseudomonas protegens]NMZ29641.1 hypothetical protein [Pseudomonas protegens]NMZ86619.1 hypothetical protein [Pseudomonas protegens]BAO59711.1 hypothetical protein PPC_0364 [Pseudomonas protegens Cab57]
MPEYNPTADEARIRLFPEHVSLWADCLELGALALPEKRPIRALRYGWVLLVMGLLGAVLLGNQGLALGLGALILCVPLMVLAIARLVHPPARADAWFDAHGLHLVCGTPKGPGAVYRHFIAFADISRVATLEQSIDLGRRGHAQYRTYLVESRQYFAGPTSIHISTQGSLEALHAVLERLGRLPAAAHIVVPPTRHYPAPSASEPS